MRRRGLFITLEGTEGAGKSTLIRGLEDAFRARGFVPTVTREPGGTGVAEEIRHILLHQEMSPRTELLLYQAARAEHLAQVIVPTLEENRVVLCDRFTDSTLAYQGHARGLPWKEILLLNRLTTEGIRPDLTLWLDIDPKTGLDRASDANRFEREGVEFQKRVRAGFAKAMKERPGSWYRIPVGNRTPEETLKLAWGRIEKKFGAFLKRSPGARR